MRQVSKGKKSSPRRVLLYGVGGIGKSTLAATFPKPIFMDLENGLSDIDTASVTVSDYLDFMQFTEELHEEHEYRTLVVDTIDQLEDFCSKQAAMNYGVETPEEVDWGKGTSLRDHLFNSCLSALAALQIQRRMMIVLIGHAEVHTFKDPRTEPYDRYRPRLNKNLVDPVVEWCDEVLFANYVTHLKKGKGQQPTKATGDGTRVLFTQERPAWIAKNRCAMPEKIEMTWDAYAGYAFPKQPESKGADA